MVQGLLGHVLFLLEIHLTQHWIHLAIQLNQNMRTPSHHGYLEMARLGWKHCHTWPNPCHDNKESHAIPCIRNLARRLHMKIDTYKESYCSCLILPFPAWSLLPLSLFAFLYPMPKCSKKTKCMLMPRKLLHQHRGNPPGLDLKDSSFSVWCGGSDWI